MVGLIPYLLNEKKLDYVLSGNLQSDPLEGRFGRYRRSAGTNYLISVRQILEAEKAIRIQSLVSIDGFNIKEIREIFSDISAEKSMEVEINSGLITEYCHENNMEFSSLQKGDEGIKYYCAGFVARSLIKRSRCEDCKSLFIADVNPPNIVLLSDDEVVDADTFKKKETFLQSINRGGLCTASDLVYIACMHVFNFHEKIFGDTEFRKLFLSFPSPRVVFIASLKMLVEERKWLVQALFESQCGSGHKFRDVFSLGKMCFQHLFKELLLGNQFNNPQEQKEKETAAFKTIKQCQKDC